MYRNVLVEYGPTATDIQNAINDAIVATDDVKRTLYLSGRVWTIDTQLNIPTTARPIRIVGDPHDIYGSGGTILRISGSLSQPLTSVLAILSQYHVLHDLKIDANRKAKYGIYVDNWTFGRANGVMVTGALIDGIYCAGTGNNDSIHMENDFLDANGTVYASPGIVGEYSAATRSMLASDAAITSGNTTITFSGTPNLTGLPIRAGDFVRVGRSVTLSSLTSSGTTATGTTPSPHGWRVGQTVTIKSASPIAYNGTYTIAAVPTTTTFTYVFAGAGSAATGAIAVHRQSAFYGMIETVNASTLTLQGQVNNLPTFTASAQDFAIGVGDGWHEERQTNNNANVFDNCVFRGSAGAGIRMRGLYGDTITGGLADFNNFFGIAIGDADNQSLVYESSMNNIFTEGNLASDYYFGSASDVSLLSPTRNDINLMLNTSVATGVILQNGVAGSIVLGTPQNFLLEIKNDGGMLKHHFVADHYGAWASLQAGNIRNASAAFTPFLTVSPTVDFSGGAGVYSTFPHILLLDALQAQNNAISGILSIEYDDTGTGPYTPLFESNALDVAGLTIIRPAIYLTKNGVLQNWSTTTIPSGKTLGIRVQAYVK